MKPHPILKTLALFSALAFLSPLSAPAQTTAVPASPPAGRLVVPFDSSWRFHKDDAPGAEQLSFDDKTWRALDVPHDWSIEGSFAQDNPAARGGAYLPTGVGWYRKSFTLPAADAGKRVVVNFDGIMANADVWVNGQHLGKRPSGYVGVNYDLTGKLNFGPDKPNVIAVRSDNTSQPASRYYTGSGITRHVRLMVTDPVHVANWGLYVTTPAVTPASATVSAKTWVTNDSPSPRTVSVQTQLVGPDGQAAPSGTTAPQTIAPGATAQFTQEITVANPKLWDLAQPNLYRAVAKVVENGKALDDETARFGIRKIEFKPETGFWLNDKNIKILGVCLHEDGGAVGAAVPRSVYEARLAAVKAMGANAIRWSHNPPSPDMLDACDELGLLAMDEMFDCWTVAKPNAERGYTQYFNDWSLLDLRDAVVRDRNHPSVVLYSAGNEIHDTPQAEKAYNILWGLVSTFHQYDPSRPVTQALFRPNADGNHVFDNGIADLLDVIGTNYRNAELITAQRTVPTRKIINTEEQQNRQAWLSVRDNPPLAGDFLWAGVDYLGEGRVAQRPPGVEDPPGAWPNIGSASGLFDRTAAPKPTALERASWWSAKPVVYLTRNREPGNAAGIVPNSPSTAAGTAVDWSPRPGSNYAQAAVSALSNCDEVELFLNGQSLGAQPKPADDSPRIWNVPYTPGTLKAVGRNNGKEVAANELRTAGAPAKITLTADRASIAPVYDDIVYVRAIITDANGERIPWAEDLVTFKADGPGKIVATDNGSYSDHTVFSSNARAASQGRAVGLLRATAPAGKITVTASAEGLASGSVVLDAAPQRTIPAP